MEWNDYILSIRACLQRMKKRHRSKYQWSNGWVLLSSPEPQLLYKAWQNMLFTSTLNK